MKPTKAQLQKQLRYLKDKHDLLCYAYRDAMAGNINWYAAAHGSDGDRYRFGLSNLDGAMAGILHIRHRNTNTGQKDHYTAQYLDDAQYYLQLDSRTDGEWSKVSGEAINKAIAIRREAFSKGSD